MHKDDDAGHGDQNVCEALSPHTTAAGQASYNTYFKSPVVSTIELPTLQACAASQSSYMYVDLNGWG